MLEESRQENDPLLLTDSYCQSTPSRDIDQSA